MVPGRKDGDKAQGRRGRGSERERERAAGCVVCLCTAGELVKQSNDRIKRRKRKKPKRSLCLAASTHAGTDAVGSKGRLQLWLPIGVSTARVLIALRLQKCCRGNRMEMGIIMYSWCRRPGGCGAGSPGTALYPEPDVSGQNHSTQDSSRILRSHDRGVGGGGEEGEELKLRAEKEDDNK